MNQSSQEMNQYFKQCCEEFDKLFIPDAVKDEAILNSLISYFRKNYDKDTLEQCIRLYCKTETDPILIYNFAIESRKTVEKVTEDLESKKEFKRILEDTEKRMASFNDLRN